ncbi:flavin reductase family protein [Insolitispirillum peregrinum]|nr:flavin reductase family protein [Insolitispirillum peregrinum]
MISEDARMFYSIDENDHGLPFNPFKGCVVPRPIGWISTRSASGVNNLAPYSFFNAISDNPPMVVYGSNGQQPHGPKDTLRNIEETGVFVVNVATWDLRDAMNASSHPHLPEVDEFQSAGLSAEMGRLVAAPRVVESPISLECRLHQVLDLPSDDPASRNAAVFGRVVAIHIDPQVLTNGQVDPRKLRPIARLGYRDYAVINDVFAMTRPGGGDARIGL